MSRRRRPTGTVVYPGLAVHGKKVDILGYKGDVNLGGGIIAKGPHVICRRAGDRTGLRMCLRADQVKVDER